MSRADAPVDLQGGRLPRADDRVGTVLAGRYEVVAVLGSGGTATVYLARHTVLDQDVALKLLHATDNRRLKRFAREARAASRIDHPNVVSVLEFGVTEDRVAYIAMDYVPGRGLYDEIMHSGGLSLARTNHILAQIAVALDRSHALGVLHRDIKPENVMLTHRGSDADVARLLDFGLAKALDADPTLPRLTSTGEIFGTPAYMAPEQWRGAPTDVRTDIYALGALAYEMLLGRTPFGGKLREQLRGHLESTVEAPELTGAGETVPGPLRTIIARALRKAPQDRFQSMGEILPLLGEVWKHVEPPARHTTYAATAAAPARAPGDTQSGRQTDEHRLHVVWDGPTVCAELIALLQQRWQRRRQLLVSTWGDSPPDEVRALDNEAAQLERAVEARVDELRETREHFELASVMGREEESVWRREIVDASIAAASEALSLDVAGDEDPTHPMEIPEGLLDDDVAASQPFDLGSEPGMRRHRAERRVLAIRRKQLADALQAQADMADQIAATQRDDGRLRQIEAALADLVEAATGEAAAGPGRRAAQWLREEDSVLRDYRRQRDALASETVPSADA